MTFFTKRSVPGKLSEGQGDNLASNRSWGELGTMIDITESYIADCRFIHKLPSQAFPECVAIMLIPRSKSGRMGAVRMSLSL